jgi:hypothetical protein
MSQNVNDRLKKLFPNEEADILLEAMLLFLENNPNVLPLMRMQMSKHIETAKVKHGRI